MTNAADVQINTGPTASVVHHAAAWVQDLTGLDAVWSLGIAVGGGAWVVVAVCCSVGYALGDRSPHSQR